MLTFQMFAFPSRKHCEGEYSGTIVTRSQKFPMRQSKFSKTKIVSILKEVNAGNTRAHTCTGHTLEQSEAEAREARKGLWVDPQPVPPWEWRSVSRPT